MKKVDLRDVETLKPKHLIETERGLVIGCQEMKHLEDNLYQCTDLISCGIVYWYFEFVGYAVTASGTDYNRMYPSEVDHAPMKCNPRCAVLKRNSDCNFVCASCDGYWYMKPGQKFLTVPDDLHFQDKRVIKFMLVKLRESVDRLKSQSENEHQERKFSYGFPELAKRLKEQTEMLDDLLNNFLQKYEI